LELLPNAESLRTRQVRLGRFSTNTAMLIGRAIAALHSLSHEISKSTPSKNPVEPPWVLSIHRPHLSALREISGANLELTKVLQSSAELCQDLDELKQGWRVDAFIHHDLKGENIVISAKYGEKKLDIKIVDWECAGFGDACWDVGSFFAEYIGSWLFSIPLMANAPPDSFISLATLPLETMQPAMLGFWKAYSCRMGLDLTTSQQWLVRAVRYAAARMLQTGYEYLQYASRCTGHILYLVQICLNILRRPREASVHLFGIPGPYLAPQ
jgi:serine/threonine protein kinase